MQPGLRLHGEGERYSALLKDRERLLRSIGTKKQKLERALTDSREARRAVLEQLQPLLMKFEAATAELRALFEGLLAPGRLSASAAKQVAKVRQTLAGFGFLGELAHDDEASEPDGSGVPYGEGDDARSSHEPHPPRDADSTSESHERREVGSAAQRGQGKDGESLRAVFRRLVAVSHPDRASNEADRELRTATMKQATQAYEAGDLARLLELEKAWRRGQSLPPVASAEASCRELERVIVELRAQASQLQRALRAAQHSGSLTQLEASIVDTLEEAKADVAQLETLCGFVTRFRDGKMSLSEFVRGPPPAGIDEDEDIEAILAEALGLRASKPTPASKPTRTAKRQPGKARQRAPK